MSPEEPSGLVVVEKPRGPTSHDVVEIVRGLLDVKAGHAGTLDPQATGVLLVCVGRATRLSRFLQSHDKVYEGTVRFGWATTTYDAEGDPVSEPVDPPEFDPRRVESELRAFEGTIEQLPPAYSAKKIRGEPAYRRARRGEEVEPDPVEVRIDSIRLLDVAGGDVKLRVECGPGTYVRTLAHDLGRRLGCPAHLASLRRLRSGPFSVEDAVPWKLLEAAEREALEERVVPPAGMMPDWPAAIVDAEGALRVTRGNVLETRDVVERRAGADGTDWPAGPGGWVRVLDDDGSFLAAAEVLPGGTVQPRVVIGG